MSQTKHITLLTQILSTIILVKIITPYIGLNCEQKINISISLNPPRGSTNPHLSYILCFTLPFFCSIILQKRPDLRAQWLIRSGLAKGSELWGLINDKYFPVKISLTKFSKGVFHAIWKSQITSERREIDYIFQQLTITNRGSRNRMVMSIITSVKCPRGRNRHSAIFG
jgi:hypothetical protein